MKRYNLDFGKMLDVAIDRHNWDTSDVKDELLEEYSDEKIKQANEEVFEYLKTVTEGDARGIVDAHEDQGLEAWWRLFHRFRPKGLRGATDIADKIQNIKKPANTMNTFTLLQKLENDIRDFAKASPGEPMPSAIIRASMLKCVPAVIENAVKLQVDIDTIETSLLRTKLEQHAKSDNGPRPMDIGAVSGAEQRQEEPEQPAPAAPDPGGVWYDDKGNAMIPQDKLELYGLKGPNGKGKGKHGGGKGKFNGCAICGQPDHWKNECPENHNKGNGQGWKGKGKGQWWKGKGQGWKGKGKGGYNQNSKGSTKGKGSGIDGFDWEGQGNLDDHSWWDQQYQGADGQYALGLFIDDSKDKTEKFIEKPETKSTSVDKPRDKAPQDFQVPAKHVKSLRKQKIKKTQSESNKVEVMQDVVQKSGVMHASNSDKRNSTDIDLGNNVSDHCFLKSTLIRSKFGRQKCKYARRTARRRQKAALREAEARTLDEAAIESKSEAAKGAQAKVNINEGGETANGKEHEYQLKNGVWEDPKCSGKCCSRSRCWADWSEQDDIDGDWTICHECDEDEAEGNEEKQITHLADHGESKKEEPHIPWIGGVDPGELPWDGFFDLKKVLNQRMNGDKKHAKENKEIVDLVKKIGERFPATQGIG